MKKLTALILSLILVCMTACAAKPGQPERKFEIVVVPADADAPEAEPMAQGVKAYNETDDTINAYQTKSQVPPDLQVPLVEDLIAQEVDAICVVPVDETALDPMLQKAQEQGIVVVSYGGENLEYTDYDIEATLEPEQIGQTMVAVAAKALHGEELTDPVTVSVDGVPALHFREGSTVILDAE